MNASEGPMPRAAPGSHGGLMSDKKLTVLIVDDSRTVLAQIEKVVAANEIVEVVGTARNGAEAVQQVSQLHPDLVLMDIVMPDVDGLAALRLIQSKNPETRVAMLSSVGAMASKAEEAFRLGAIQVLSKPIDEEILEALMELFALIIKQDGGMIMNERDYVSSFLTKQTHTLRQTRMFKGGFPYDWAHSGLLIFLLDCCVCASRQPHNDWRNIFN